MSADRRIEAAARALNTEGWTCYGGGDEPGLYDTCPRCKKACDKLAKAALAAADAASIVTTATGLDSLPDESVVIDKQGDVFQRRGDWWCGHETVPLPSRQLAKFLPARVLYRGQP